MAKTEPQTTGSDLTKPTRSAYLSPDGTLVIPFDSDAKYHWWKGGPGVQSVQSTHTEVLAQVNATSAVQGGQASVG